MMPDRRALPRCLSRLAKEAHPRASLRSARPVSTALRRGAVPSRRTGVCDRQAVDHRFQRETQVDVDDAALLHQRHRSRRDLIARLTRELPDDLAHREHRHDQRLDRFDHRREQVGTVGVSEVLEPARSRRRAAQVCGAWPARSRPAVRFGLDGGGDASRNAAQRGGRLQGQQAQAAVEPDDHEFCTGLKLHAPCAHPAE